MKETLRQLDAELRKARPRFYTALRQPVTGAEINVLEEQHELKIPTDLRTLYQWKNGQDESCFETFVNNSMFLSLQDALAIAAEHTSLIGFDFEIKNWWHQKWIPLFHNGGGDYICYDTAGIFTGQPGQLLQFRHADNDRNVLAPSLETFIYSLSEYYNNRPESDIDEYILAKKIEGYPKKFKVK